MNNRTRFPSTWTRCGKALAALFVLAAAGAAHADSVKVEFTGTLPDFQVVGNGTNYTMVQGGGATTTVGFTVIADSEVAGQVRGISWHATGTADGGIGASYSLPPASGGQSYSGLWHKKESLAGSFPIAPTELVAACNRHAEGLRAQGKTDQEIFLADRTLNLHVRVTPDASFSASSPFMDQVPADIFSHITCKQWAGMAGGFSPPPQLTATEGVTDSSLTLIEQYGPSGMCKIILSGVIRTTSANMDVKFRYEHFDGKKSEVKTVTTDATKTVFFSDEYNVPNGDGPEGGTVKMVGVAPTFTSNNAAYSMDCTEGAASGFQASLMPKLSLAAMPNAEANIGGQVCPTKLRLTGTIAGQGGGTIAGQAFFAGPGYASPHHAYQVSGTQTTNVQEFMDLEWETSPAVAFATQNSPAPMKSQTVIVGFNIMGSNNTEIGNVPQRSFTVNCTPVPGPAAPASGLAAPGQAAGEQPTSPMIHVHIPNMSDSQLKPQNAPGASRQPPGAVPAGIQAPKLDDRQSSRELERKPQDEDEKKRRQNRR